MKADCDGNCTNCNETELPNIKDKDCKSIGYSYAYKTDCAGDRYIKAEEVKYLLKCERNKAIDDFVKALRIEYSPVSDEMQNEYDNVCLRFEKIAEQLKAGEKNEQSI